MSTEACHWSYFHLQNGIRQAVCCSNHNISQAALLFQNQWVWARFLGESLMAFHCNVGLLILIYLKWREVLTGRTGLDCSKTRMTTGGCRYFIFGELCLHRTFKCLLFLSLAVFKPAVGWREACTSRCPYCLLTNDQHNQCWSCID